MSLQFDQVDAIGEASTGDITYQDSRLMLNEECPLCIFINDAGYLLYVPQDHTGEALQDVLDAGLSHRLIDLVEAAIAQKLRYIRIDQDGSPVRVRADESWDDDFAYTGLLRVGDTVQSLISFEDSAVKPNDQGIVFHVPVPWTGGVDVKFPNGRIVCIARSDLRRIRPNP